MTKKKLPVATTPAVVALIPTVVQALDTFEKRNPPEKLVELIWRVYSSILEYALSDTGKLSGCTGFCFGRWAHKFWQDADGAMTVSMIPERGCDRQRVCPAATNLADLRTLLKQWIDLRHGLEQLNAMDRKYTAGEEAKKDTCKKKRPKKRSAP